MIRSDRNQSGISIMKIVSSLFLAGLIATTLTMPAAAAPPIDPAHPERYWTPQKAKEWNSGFEGCMRICQETGWTASESAVYCNSRWNHMFDMNRMIPAGEKFGN